MAGKNNGAGKKQGEQPGPITQTPAEPEFKGPGQEGRKDSSPPEGGFVSRTGKPPVTSIITNRGGVKRVWFDEDGRETHAESIYA